MIGKIQDYKLKEVKVKKDEATVTFTSLSVSFHGAEAAVRTILMSPYGINIDKLKYWIRVMMKRVRAKISQQSSFSVKTLTVI